MQKRPFDELTHYYIEANHKNIIKSVLSWLEFNPLSSETIITNDYSPYELKISRSDFDEKYSEKGFPDDITTFFKNAIKLGAVILARDERDGMRERLVMMGKSGIKEVQSHKHWVSLEFR